MSLVAPKEYWKVGLCGVLAGQSMVFSLSVNLAALSNSNPWYYWIHGLLILSAIITIYILGLPLIKSTFNYLKIGQITLESLFTLSLVGALACSLLSTFYTHEAIYYETVIIVCFIYTVGRWINAHTKEKAVAKAKELRNQLAYAYVYDSQQKRIQVPLNTLKVGDVVSIIPGDLISVDGLILSGQGFVTQTALTGEPGPVLLKPEDDLLAGTYSIDGTYTVQIKALEQNRQIDYILDTVEGAIMTPSLLQARANKLMQWFVPLVLGVCFCTFIGWLIVGSFSAALFHSMCVLLVACPCALGLATPVAVYAGLFSLSSLGIVSKNGYILDVLAKATDIILDKTGTLTDENLRITNWLSLPSLPITLEDVQGITALIQQKNHHVLAQAFLDFCPPHTQYTVIDLKIIPGEGLSAHIQCSKTSQNYSFLIGSLSLMPKSTHDAFVSFHKGHLAIHRCVYISIDEKPCSIVLLEESLRPSAIHTLQGLKKLGLHVQILSGDPNPKWIKMDKIPVVYGLKPEDKARVLEALKSQNRCVLYVGDGLNDSPSMALADASIALSNAAPLAQYTASAVLMGGNLSALIQAIPLAKQIYNINLSNYYFSILYNTIGMGLAAFGFLTPILAAIIMFVSSLFVSYRAFSAAQVRI